MLQLHRHYERGVLPFGRGLLEQPLLFMQAMDVIEAQ